MGFLDTTDAEMIALTRERRAERLARAPTLYFGGSRSIIKFPERPDPAIQKSMRRKAKKVTRQAARARHLESADKYQRIFELQHCRCYLCRGPFEGIAQATDDHVTPQALGGRRVGNILHACFGCNNGKADRAPFPCELLYLESINIQLPRAMLRRAGGGYVQISQFTPLRLRSEERLTA